MKSQRAREIKFLFAMILVAGSLAFLRAEQIQNPIQAAKDAYNKAKQQQQQQQQNKPPQQPAPPGQATQPANAPVQPSAAAPGSPVENADCCTPEAMKKIAASIGFVDIVGIKLGMTPAQAVAAVKAYNPNLKIETLTSRLEHPSGTPEISLGCHILLTRTLQTPDKTSALWNGSPCSLRCRPALPCLRKFNDTLDLSPASR